MKTGPSSVSRDEPALSHGRLFFPYEGEVDTINNGPIKTIHSSANAYNAPLPVSPAALLPQLIV